MTARRPRILFFIGCIFSVVLFSFFNGQLFKGVQRIPCADLLKNNELPFPAMLIDTFILENLQAEKCQQSRNPLNIAIEAEYINHINRLNQGSYNIYIYEIPKGTKYLKFHGTETRGIPLIETKKVGNWIIPKNIPLFKEYWKRSRLLDCLGLDMERDETKSVLPLPESIVVLENLSKLLVSLNMFPFLAGGTMLGWYRECGIILHTTDMDLYVRIEELNQAFLKVFRKGNSEFKTAMQLGKPSDGFEIKVMPTNGTFNFITDIFFMYNNGVNESWVTGTSSDGLKYQYVYPLNYDPYCAADLYGSLFWVTCHPDSMLNLELGTNWREDHISENFSWYSSTKNSRLAGKWESAELKETFKVY